MIKILVASWKSGFGLFHADAQKVANEIAEIGESATPQEILEKGRDPKTELHKCFEWDDTVAAEKYRIQQARSIVHCLVIKETDDNKGNRPELRMFYKTSNDEGYKPTSIIMQNKDEYQKLLERAFAELAAFKSKYHSLAELDGVFEQIDLLAM